MIYVVPVILVSVFTIALIKRKDVFGTFTSGIAEAVKLTVKLVPYLTAVFMLIAILRKSGMSVYIAKALNPLFSLLGIPKELSELIILRPLSGSGSLAVLQNIYAEYGADSYVGVTASVIMGSTDTVLYVASVYFSVCEDKKTGSAVAIALVCSLIGAICSCMICRLTFAR